MPRMALQSSGCAGSVSEAKVTVTQSCTTLCDPMDGRQPTRILCPLDFRGKNTGVGCHFLLQGLFLTRGLNSSLLNWQADSLPLSHQERIVDLQYEVSFKVYNRVIQLHINIYTHMYVYIYVLFQILLHYRLSQDIEYSSMCYIVGSYCLFILHIVVCIHLSPYPNLTLTLSLFLIIVAAVVVVQLLSCVRLFVTPWTAALKAPLSFTISQSLLRFMCIESVILSYWRLQRMLPSHPLLPTSPFALNLSQDHGLF